jgi:hypothetical protein
VSDQERQPDPRSGVAADGTWTPAFEGQRPPLRPGHEHRVEAGNDLAVKHGAYAELALSPRVEALMARLRVSAEHLTAADEAGLAVAALSAIQLSVATGAVEEVAEAIERGDDVDTWLGRLESRSRLSKDARGWSNTVRQWFDTLGLTPKGRRDLEERTLTVFHQHEVHAALRSWLEIGSRYVEPGRFDAFMDEVEAAFARLDAGVPELPAGDVVEGRASPSEGDASAQA